MVATGLRTAWAVSEPGGRRIRDWRSGTMISLNSWWWPKRPARVPRPATSWLVACVGAALFGVSALVLKTGKPSWDESLFRLLNQVPAAAAAVLTPLSRLFL